MASLTGSGIVTKRVYTKDWGEGRRSRLRLGVREMGQPHCAMTRKR